MRCSVRKSWRCMGVFLSCCLGVSWCVLVRFFVPRPSGREGVAQGARHVDRKSTRLNSSHLVISYAVFCLKKKKANTKDSVLVETIVNHVHIHRPAAALSH